VLHSPEPVERARNLTEPSHVMADVASLGTSLPLRMTKRRHGRGPGSRKTVSPLLYNRGAFLACLRFFDLSLKNLPLAFHIWGVTRATLGRRSVPYARF
jgi:hypothetical protein